MIKNNIAYFNYNFHKKQMFANITIGTMTT